MSQNKIESLEKAFTGILHWGIIINVFLPIALFFLAILLREKLFQIQSIRNADLLFYILIIISFGEILFIFILRKKLWENLTQEKTQNDSNIVIEQNLFGFGMIIYALSLAPTIYGLVYFLLGGTWERFALFIAITFLSFQFFKPREGDIEKLISDIRMD